MARKLVRTFENGHQYFIDEHEEGQLFLTKIHGDLAEVPDAYVFLVQREQPAEIGGIRGAGSPWCCCVHVLDCFKSTRIVIEPIQALGFLVEQKIQLKFDDEVQGVVAAIRQLGDDRSEALHDFIKCVGNTGGVVLHNDGLPVPAVDREWIDLGEAYIKGCRALGIEPDIHPE